MSEKYPLLAEEEECFFLTSPFIEPDGHGRLGIGGFCEVNLNRSHHHSVFVARFCSSQDCGALPHFQFQLVHVGLGRKWVGLIVPMPLKPEREAAFRSLPNVRLGRLTIPLLFQAEEFSCTFCWSERTAPDDFTAFDRADVSLCCGRQGARVNGADCRRVQFLRRPKLLQKRQNLVEVRLATVPNLRHATIVSDNLLA